MCERECVREKVAKQFPGGDISLHGVDELQHVFESDVLQPQSLELLSLAAQKTLAGLQVLLQSPDLLLGIYIHQQSPQSPLSPHVISLLSHMSQLPPQALLSL